jgi:hypothetical protein
MKELLIHIGYHKSGTTWLQDGFFCRSEMGFTVPSPILRHLAIEYFVIKNPFRFDGAEARREFVPWLRETFEADLVPVITHENLCGNPIYERYYGKEVAERLHSAFPSARILIGIREQLSSIMSHYREYVREGNSGTIQRFIGSLSPQNGFPPICRLDHFEYHLLIDHYRRLFGPDRVLVLPLELLRADYAGYIAAIRRFAESAVDALPSPEPRKVGWGGVTLGIRRRMNNWKVGVPDWSKSRQSITYRVVDKLCDITDGAIPARMDRWVEQSVLAYIRQRCGDYFAESNQALSEMIGMDLDKFGYVSLPAESPATAAEDLPVAMVQHAHLGASNRERSA